MHVPGVVTVTSWGPPPVDRLSGVLFVDDAIVIGDDGLAAYLAEAPAAPRVEALRDGRFTLVLVERDAIHARCDDMGQDTLYHYADAERWAFSNSLLALCEALADAGVRLRPFPPGLAAFWIGNLSRFGGQAVSHDTPVEGVRALPMDRALRVRRDVGTSRLEVVPLPPPDAAAAYEDALVAHAEAWRDRLHTLAGRGPVGMHIDLSGGYDSRFCFGLAYPVLPDGAAVALVSDANKAADVGPAALVRAHYGVDEGPRLPNPTTIDAAAAYRVWRLGNVGAYMPVYLPRHRSEAAVWRLHGGHFRVATYGDVPPRERARRFERALARAGAPVDGFAASFLGAFADVGVDLDDPEAMQEHYLHFRARAHYGRAWFQATRAFILTPLLSGALRAAERRLRRADLTRKARWRRLTCDLLTLLDPDLATIPFDDPAKAFTAEELRASPFVRTGGAALRAARVLRVYPERVPAPPRRVDALDQRSLREGFRRLAGEDLERWGEAARTAGLLPPESLDEARAVLRERRSGANDSAPLARALSACAVAELCGL